MTEPCASSRRSCSTRSSFRVPLKNVPGENTSIQACNEPDPEPSRQQGSGYTNAAPVINLRIENIILVAVPSLG